MQRVYSVWAVFRSGRGEPSLPGTMGTPSRVGPLVSLARQKRKDRAAAVNMIPPSSTALWTRKRVYLGKQEMLALARPLRRIRKTT